MFNLLENFFNFFNKIQSNLKIAIPRPFESEHQLNYHSVPTFYNVKKYNVINYI